MRQTSVLTAAATLACNSCGAMPQRRGLVLFFLLCLHAGDRGDRQSPAGAGRHVRIPAKTGCSAPVMVS